MKIILMKHLRYIFLGALFVCAAVTMQAQKDAFNPVYYGVTSLAIAPDSRAGAMGDVGAATDPDVNSQYWNPAKYPFNISRAGVSLAYTPWLRKLVNDIDLAQLTGYYRIGDYQAVSSSLRYFSLGDVTIQQSQDDTGYSIKPYEMAFDVAYSRMLSQNFSAAVALRFIYSDMAYKEDEAMSPGSAFAADIAMYYNKYVIMGQRECNLAFGLDISNIGSKISYDKGNTSEFLPTNLRFGSSLLIPIDNYNRFSVSADLNKLLVPTRPLQNDGESDEDYQTRLDNEYRNISPISGIFKSFHDAPGGLSEELKEIYWGLGCEYTYHDQFALRAGYHNESASKGNRKYFTVGAGFKMSVFSLDTAYLISTAQNNPLDQTLRFTLSFDMNGIKEIFGKK